MFRGGVGRRFFSGDEVMGVVGICTSTVKKVPVGIHGQTTTRYVPPGGMVTTGTGGGAVGVGVEL